MLRIVYIIVMVLPASSLYKECSSSMDDDKIYYYNDSVMLPLESYCFVNEHTIRIKESNVLLNVINNTGDWIIATNTTNMFTACINGSINNCSSDNTEATSSRFDTALYIIQFVSCFIGIIAGVANISIHLIYKELRTVFGILIIIFCTLACIGWSITSARITFNYYQINISVRACMLFLNFTATIIFNFHETTRTVALAHLVYAMYRSYRVCGGKENKKLLLCKYITFIIVASTVCSAIIITAEVVTNESFFNLVNGQCALNYNISDGLMIAIILRYVNYLIWIFIQIILATITLVLYFLTTKQCCAASRFRDIRVSVVVIFATDLTFITFAAFLILGNQLHFFRIILTVTFVVEQICLFVLFASSSKVTCCCMKKTTSTSCL